HRQLRGHFDRHHDRSPVGEYHLETRGASAVVPTRADGIGQWELIDPRQRSPPPRRLAALLAGDRGEPSDKRNGVEIPGLASDQLLHATARKCAAATKRKYPHL